MAVINHLLLRAKVKNNSTDYASTRLANVARAGKLRYVSCSATNPNVPFRPRHFEVPAFTGRVPSKHPRRVQELIPVCCRFLDTHRKSSGKSSATKNVITISSTVMANVRVRLATASSPSID